MKSWAVRKGSHDRMTHSKLDVLVEKIAIIILWIAER